MAGENRDRRGLTHGCRYRRGWLLAVAACRQELVDAYIVGASAGGVGKLGGNLYRLGIADDEKRVAFGKPEPVEHDLGGKGELPARDPTRWSDGSLHTFSFPMKGRWHPPVRSSVGGQPRRRRRARRRRAPVRWESGRGRRSRPRSRSRGGARSSASRWRG